MKRATKIGLLSLLGLMLGSAAIVVTANTVMARGGMGGSMSGGMGGMGGGLAQLDFNEVDKNGNGLVTLEEMQARAEALFAQVDADGSGLLDGDEMAAHITASIAEKRTEGAAAGEKPPKGGRLGWHSGGDMPDEKRISWIAEGVILQKDENDDGLLSMAEFQLPTATLERLIDRVDTDDDNAMSEAELEAAQQERGQRRGGHGGPPKGRP